MAIERAIPVGGGASLNFSVVGGTTQPSNPQENTIWVNTDAEISKWVFSSDAPGSYKVDVNVIEGLTPKAGMLNENGGINSQSTTYLQQYFEEYIPVTAGESFTWDFAFPSGQTRSIWLGYCSYKSDKTFIARTAVADVSRSSITQTFVIPTGVSYIRVAYRSFGETPENTIIVHRTMQGTVDEGLLWIKTGSSSPVGFNALKKNELMLMPLSVAQYIGGEWVSKTAQSFMNGVWASWLRYLVQEGVVNTNTAGQLVYELSNTNQSVSYEDGYVAVSSTGSGNVKMYFEDTIDFSEVDTVEVDIYSKNGTYLSGYVGVSAEKTPMTSDSTNNTIAGLAKCVASANLENDSTQNRHTVSLDVSEVVGAFYLCLCFASTGGGIDQDNRIYNITLK